MSLTILVNQELNSRLRTLDLSYDASDRTYNPAAWGQNQKITYNFIISANAIEFGDPTVEDWTTTIPDVEVPSIN